MTDPERDRMARDHLDCMKRIADAVERIAFGMPMIAGTLFAVAVFYFTR